MHQARALGSLAAVLLSLSTGLWHASFGELEQASPHELRAHVAHGCDAWLEPGAEAPDASDPQREGRVGGPDWVASRAGGLASSRASCARHAVPRESRGVHGRDRRAAILRCRARLASEPDLSIV